MNQSAQTSVTAAEFEDETGLTDVNPSYFFELRQMVCLMNQVAAAGREIIVIGRIPYWRLLKRIFPSCFPIRKTLQKVQLATNKISVPDHHRS